MPRTIERAPSGSDDSSLPSRESVWQKLKHRYRATITGEERAIPPSFHAAYLCARGFNRLAMEVIEWVVEAPQEEPVQETQQMPAKTWQARIALGKEAENSVKLTDEPGKLLISSADESLVIPVGHAVVACTLQGPHVTTQLEINAVDGLDASFLKVRAAVHAAGLLASIETAAVATDEYLPYRGDLHAAQVGVSNFLNDLLDVSEARGGFTLGSEQGESIY